MVALTGKRSSDSPSSSNRPRPGCGSTKGPMTFAACETHPARGAGRPRQWSARRRACVAADHRCTRPSPIQANSSSGEGPRGEWPSRGQSSGTGRPKVATYSVVRRCRNGRRLTRRPVDVHAELRPEPSNSPAGAMATGGARPCGGGTGRAWCRTCTAPARRGPARRSGRRARPATRLARAHGSVRGGRGRASATSAASARVSTVTARWTSAASTGGGRRKLRGANARGQRHGQHHTPRGTTARAAGPRRASRRAARAGRWRPVTPGTSWTSRRSASR